MAVKSPDDVQATTRGAACRAFAGTHPLGAGRRGTAPRTAWRRHLARASPASSPFSRSPATLPPTAFQQLSSKYRGWLQLKKQTRKHPQLGWLCACSTLRVNISFGSLLEMWSSAAIPPSIWSAAVARMREPADSSIIRGTTKEETSKLAPS